MNMKFPFLDSWVKNRSNGHSLLLKFGEDDITFREQFRSLRAKFETRTMNSDVKTVAITSTVAGEGKTLSCAQLGANLAASGRKNVLLIDADNRKADLTKGMQLARNPGLTEILLGTVDDISKTIRSTGVEGLHVLPAGIEVAAPADLFSKDGFPKLLREIRNKHDFVLIDTPPVAAVAEMMTIRDHVDGIIFIYKAGFTPIPMFRNATEDIGFPKILGVIINGAEQKSQRYYNHYYGHYYQTKKQPQA